MALTRTTLSGGCSATDFEILVASIAGLSVGSSLKCDGEQMRVQAIGSSAAIPVKVLRGVGGTAVVAHPASAGVVFGDPADFLYKPQSGGKGRDVVSYSASGALTLPVAGRDVVAILNGTGALAMTLADPSKENDGDMLFIASNGKAAHTVTTTTGYGDGGASYVKFTFAAGARNVLNLVAINERWVTSLIGGTATAITTTVSA